MTNRFKKALVFTIGLTTFVYILSWGIGFYIVNDIRHIQSTIDRYVLGLLIGVLLFFPLIVIYTWIDGSETVAVHKKKAAPKLRFVHKAVTRKYA